jgi:hypothetical protein
MDEVDEFIREMCRIDPRRLRGYAIVLN